MKTEIFQGFFVTFKIFMMFILCFCILIGNEIFAHFRRTDHRYGLSLPSEIFCIKAVLVACSYAVSNSGPVHTYEEKENKLQLDQIGICSYGVLS